MDRVGERDVLDKLGLWPGMVGVLLEEGWVLDSDVRLQLEERVRWDASTPADVVFITIGPASDPDSLLELGASETADQGAVWLLTRKRGLPDYVPQDTLPGLGADVGLVDNKICSVSPTISAMRFVRRVNR